MPNRTNERKEKIMGEKLTDQVVCKEMAGCVVPPLPVELVCPLCKDLVDEAVGFYIIVWWNWHQALHGR